MTYLRHCQMTGAICDLFASHHYKTTGAVCDLSESLPNDQLFVIYLHRYQTTGAVCDLSALVPDDWSRL